MLHRAVDVRHRLGLSEEVVLLFRNIDLHSFSFCVVQDVFVVGAALLDAELQRRVQSVRTAADDTQLDFSAACAHTTAQH